MISVHDIDAILRKYYSSHSSVYLTREYYRRSVVCYYNYGITPQVNHLVNAMDQMNESTPGNDENVLSELVASPRRKVTSVYKAEQYMIKRMVRSVGDTCYISLFFHGIKGVEIKRSFGKRYDAKLDYNRRPLFILHINTETRRIYTSGQRGRFAPVAFGTYISKIMLHSREFREILSEIIKLCLPQKYLIKDVIRAIEEDGFLTAPFTLFDADRYHNKQELMAALGYPDIPGYNRMSLNLAYLIGEVAGNIPEEEIDYLLQIDREDLVHIMKEIVAKSYTVEDWMGYFLPYYYFHKFSNGDLNAEEAPCSIPLFNQNIDIDLGEMKLDEEIIRDYYLMSKDQGRKVSLRFNSMQRIRAEHDALATGYRRKSLQDEFKKPLVTNRSVFTGLRERLPEDFQWITTTEDLFNEGERQHNCVFSYRDRIREDKRAIYHWDVEDRHYTIEFSVDRDGKYKIAQMLQSYNIAAEEIDIERVRRYICSPEANS